MLVIWLLPLKRWLTCNLFLDCLDYLYRTSSGDFNSALHLGQGKGQACGKHEYRNLQISQALWSTDSDAPRNLMIQKLLFGFREMFPRAEAGICRCPISVPGEAATLPSWEEKDQECFHLDLGGRERHPNSSIRNLQWNSSKWQPACKAASLFKHLLVIHTSTISWVLSSPQNSFCGFRNSTFPTAVCARDWSTSLHCLSRDRPLFREKKNKEKHWTFFLPH